MYDISIYSVMIDSLFLMILIRDISVSRDAKFIEYNLLMYHWLICCQVHYLIVWRNLIWKVKCKEMYGGALSHQHVPNHNLMIYIAYWWIKWNAFQLIHCQSIPCSENPTLDIKVSCDTKFIEYNLLRYWWFLLCQIQ